MILCFTVVRQWTDRQTDTRRQHILH